MSGSLTQFGIGKETAYGTAVTVDKFFEILQEDLKGNYGRVESESLSSSLVDRSDRSLVLPNLGGAGSVQLEVLTKNFGHWLAYMMGSVTTTGTGTTGYTHVAKMANLYGKSLTIQVGRAQEDSTVKPWTYEGCKVTGFEFSNQTNQSLRANISVDFEKESNPDTPTSPYTLAALSLPTGAEILWAEGGTITVGGMVYDVADISVKVDNALKTDRKYIRKGAGKREPVQDGKRKITWSFKVPHTDNALWKKVSSQTLSGSYATINAKWEGLTKLTGVTPDTYPSLTIDIPVARFDEGGPTVEGPSTLEVTYSGVGLWDPAGTGNGAEPLVLTYLTSDATVLPN